MSALAPATKAALSSLGYSNDLILEQYPVWLGARDTIRVDAAVFAAAPADMTTATIVVSQLNGAGNIEQPQLLRAAVALATPIAVEADGRVLRVFSVSHQSGLQIVDEFPIDAPDEITRLQTELGPRSLLDAKLGARQLTLFPMDVTLLSSARTRAKNELTPRIESTLKAVSDLLGETQAAPASEESTREQTLRSSRIIVGALTCAYVRDKNNLTDIPVRLLPLEARRRYPAYFDWLEPGSEEYELLIGAIQSISDGISFLGLAPDIITDPYERVVVSSTERRAHGVHYTPPEIAARLMQALPIEELPPNRRTILDPTCGSGTLLLAGYDRLRSLEPQPYLTSALFLEEQHQRLTAQLFGYDKDPFAVQITKLALLLHDQSGGNGWNVSVRDALSDENTPPATSILVANPPWLFLEGDRTELANQFVTKMLDALEPDGLLGMILPSSWLTSTASRHIRNRMANECDVFEVWRLPELVFPSSRAAPGVVCARKRHVPSDRWRVFRRVVATKEELQRFYNSGIATDITLTPSDRPMVTGPLSLALARKPGLQRLGDFVDMQVGSQPLPSVTRGPGRRTGTHMMLKEASDLRQFGPPPSDALIPVVFPDDFHRNTPVEIAAGKKVLVSATRWVDNPWRLKVGIDLDGIIARNSLNIVLPKLQVVPHLNEESMLFALMALIGSGLASLWIDEHATKRSYSKESFLSFPIPSDMPWQTLASIGRELFDVYDDPMLLREVVRSLEGFIWQAYALPEQTVSALVRRLVLKSPPEGGTRYPFVSPPETLISNGEWSESRIGAVLSVEDEGIQLWVNSVTPSDGVRVPLPMRFPGSLVYEDATFETDATSLKEIQYARYWPQREMWRDDEQLNEYVNT